LFFIFGCGGWVLTGLRMTGIIFEAFDLEFSGRNQALAISETSRPIFEGTFTRVARGSRHRPEGRPEAAAECLPAFSELYGDKTSEKVRGCRLTPTTIR
jgi:hypothetical protein